MSVEDNILKDVTKYKGAKEQLKEVLANEASYVSDLNKNIIKEFGALSTAVINHTKFFERKGGYTETEVRTLLTKVNGFARFFEKLATQAGKIPNDNSMIRLNRMCTVLYKGLDDLHKIIKEKGVLVFATHSRKIGNGQDIIDYLDALLKKARESVPRDLKAKYEFILHVFRESEAA